MNAHRSFLCAALLSLCAAAQTAPVPPTSDPQSTNQVPPVKETVEVTATRLAEDPQSVPTAIEVFTGDELAARGAKDLRSALSLARGVDIAPGGDAGPASAVPEFWGLKEFDAFLLVVDGVPSGGAFNPALTSLDLADVDRIEILRGPAPVTYGATSFVGVIHVIHKDPKDEGKSLTLYGGSFASGGGAFSTPVPLAGNWASRLTVDEQREGFNDDRSSFRRGHGLWRIDRKLATEGRFWINFDMNWLDQDPASPRPREGATLSPLVPVDANHNPAGAFLDDHRFTGSTGFDKAALGGEWSSIFSLSHSRQRSFRGFIEELDDVPDNTRGLRENIRLTDGYLDSHISWKLHREVTFLAGADYLHGTGRAEGVDFDYTTPVNGRQAVTVPQPSDLDVQIRDSRNFFGVYSMLEWRPVTRIRVDGGIRLNATHESLREVDPGAGTSDADTRGKVRASGNLGAIFTAWQKGSDDVGFYANYRDTFKPAAIDFGIGEEENEGGELILKPETSRSIEGGLKARLFGRRIEAEATGFLMNFENLVTAVTVGGLPALINAGSQRFQGFETGLSAFLPRNVIARASYSFHDAHFRDFVQEFDGVPTQLAGRRLEMSARHLAGFGVSYLPNRGLIGSIDVNYSGSRFLNKRNTALAEGFATVGLGLGYRTPKWDLRVDGRNLGDRRDPVSESELGESQYYVMPSRRVDATLTFRF